jgi:MFS family permease
MISLAFFAALTSESIHSSSSVFSVGAGTLADIFEPHERGSVMGIYYAAPLLGPSLGPIIGGALTDQWNWRSTFFFLAAFCSLSMMSFMLFKDTFRRERSSAYQAALAKAKRHAELSQLSRKEQKPARPKLADLHQSTKDSDEKTLRGDSTPPLVSEKKDIEAAALDVTVLRAPPLQTAPSVQDIKLSLRDVNPLAPLPQIMRYRSNLVILLASGSHFCFHHKILSLILNVS